MHVVLVRERRAVRRFARDVELAVLEQVVADVLRDLDVRVGLERDLAEHALGITPMRRAHVLEAEQVAGLVRDVLGELAGVRLRGPPAASGWRR